MAKQSVKEAKPVEAKQEVVAVDNQAAALALMEEASGMGFEDVKASDLALPQFKLLQATSAQVKRTEADYVKGAREGLWFDTISKRMFSEIVFVPCKFSTRYIEWTLETLGRLVADHGTDRTLYNKCTRDPKTGNDITPSGKSVIVPTGTWYGLVIGGNEIDPTIVEDKGTYVDLMSQAVLTFAGTAQRTSRRWVSDAQSIQLRRPDGTFFRPSIFAMSYVLASAATKNDQGSWFLPTVSRGGWTLDYKNGRAIYDQAKLFSKFATEMQAQIITAAKDDAPAAQSTYHKPESAGPREDVPLDDDIPF